MATLDVCPNCHARLDERDESAADPSTCPFCGANVAAPEPTLDEPDAMDLRPSLPGVIDGKEGSGKKPNLVGKFEVIEHSDTKLLIRIPPGGRVAFLGYFSILWLGLVGLMTPFGLREVIAGNRDGWVFLLVVLFFLLVGLGMAYAWLRLRYTETLILLEPGRAVVQRNFRRRKKIKETALTPTTRALLSTAYLENDKPVYRVLIGDETGSVTFGTSLIPEEKPRLVALINKFLEAHDSTSRAERVLPDACPACGSALTRVLIDPNARTPSCPSCNRTIVVSLPEILSPLELPTKSKVQVVESSDARQVFYVPAGGPQARAAGIMAAFWIVFMALFTPPWFVLNGAGFPPPGLIAILAFFWIAGFGLFYAWIRMQFSRTFLLLERDRLVIQRVLFGRKSTAETRLGPESRASLVESFQKNREPVYRVEVNGISGYAKFGTPLSRIEKDWFVQRINHFLGNQSVPFPSRIRLPNACPQCAAAIDLYFFEPATQKCFCKKCAAELPIAEIAGDDLTPERVVELDPMQLPEDSEVNANFEDPARLRFSLLLVPNGRVRRTLAALVLPAAALSAFFVWLIVRDIQFAGAQFQGIGFVVELIFNLMIPLVSCGFALAPLAIMAIALLGRTSVELDETQFRCRWGAGPIGPKKTLSPDAITRIAITSISIEKTDRDGRDPRKGFRTGGPGSKGCVVFANETAIPLTTFHKIETVRQVAGMLLYHLRRMGIDPADV